MSAIPPFRYDPVGDSQKAQREYDTQDTLKRVTGTGRYASGPTNGLHMGAGSVVAGIGVFVFVWFAAQAVGQNALWSIPAGMVAIPLAAVLAGRGRSRGSDRAGRRIRHPIRFFVVTGAVLCAGLGVWFALSEGDIPVVRAAATFGAIGGVLGLVPGVLLRIGRAFGARGAGRA